MPKPNKTMLDQLASMMKTSGWWFNSKRKKPVIIEEVTFRDPLNLTVEQRRNYPERVGGKFLDMTPERQKYQQGLDAVRGRYIREAEDNIEGLRGALDALQGQWDDAANEARRGYYDDLRYLNEKVSSWRSKDPGSIMEFQRESPRYHNYQSAMIQKAENARQGRVNAAVMNLARQGYSMPEIREILRMQGR